jgi:hypothetical protein
VQNQSELGLGMILQDFIAAAKSHGMAMPRDLTMLSRGVMTIEGDRQDGGTKGF